MDFSTLLQQAQKLTTETQAKEETLNVERTLPQVLLATQVSKKYDFLLRKLKKWFIMIITGTP